MVEGLEPSRASVCFQKSLTLPFTIRYAGYLRKLVSSLPHATRSPHI
jgi:hypothetical protein